MMKMYEEGITNKIWAVIATAPVGMGKKVRGRPGWYIVKIDIDTKAMQYANELQIQFDDMHSGSVLVDTMIIY